MIDIHCHILPGLDDGASTLEEARLMAAMAADDGVTDVIATPHVTWGDGDMPEQLVHIREAAEELQAQLYSAGIPLVIHVGAEVLCCGEVPERLMLETFPCIEHTSCALVEFYFDESADYMSQWLSILRDAGITPIVAHPERYAAVQRDKQLAKLWASKGYLLQLNKDSFEGRFGWRAQRSAHRMMKQGLVSFIASDAHNAHSRTFFMKQLIEKLSNKYGERHVQRLKNIDFLTLYLKC